MFLELEEPRLFFRITHERFAIQADGSRRFECPGEIAPEGGVLALADELFQIPKGSLPLVPRQSEKTGVRRDARVAFRVPQENLLDLSCFPIEEMSDLLRPALEAYDQTLPVDSERHNSI